MARSESAFPVRKVTAGALAGAATTVITGLLAHAYNFPLSAEQAAALTTIMTFIASYGTSPAEGETVSAEKGEQPQRAEDGAIGSIAEKRSGIAETELLQARLHVAQAAERELWRLLAQQARALEAVAERHTLWAPEVRPISARIRSNGESTDPAHVSHSDPTYPAR